MADIDSEGFLDFFASPSLSHGGSHLNYTFNTNASFTAFQAPPTPDAANDDDDWGDFTGPAPSEPESDRIGSDSKRIAFEKPTGPLPLSLFGEEEEERGGSGASELLCNLNAQGVSSSDTNGLNSISKTETYSNGANEGSGDEDDWEFHGAFLRDGGERNGKEEGGSEVSKEESTIVISQDQHFGQDASKFVVNNIESMSSHQFADLFTSQNGVSNKNSEVNVGTDFMENAFFPDAFMSAPLADSREIGNADVTHPTQQYENDDFDDFGDFMDAASEPGSKNQDYSIEPESHWQPFPASVFSNGSVKSDGLHQNVSDKPTFAPRNGSTIQSSEKSVHDLISSLYTQGQHAPAAACEKNAENGSHAIQKTMDSTYSDSWDFGDEVGVEERSCDVVQKESVKLQNLQTFVDFFVRLRDRLHFLASRLLEDAENNEAQEARKALHDDMGSEIHLEKTMSISGCLSDIIEDLRRPTFQIIETEYLLSRRLSLAEKDWKMAIKLLKETTLIAKILESGLGYDQSVYISNWSNIVNVCAQELRYGALIWKHAVENNLQIQILSDSRGQCYIQGLGEIYRVVQLFGLSAKVYKPWMLINMESQSSLFLLLDECSELWSNSGLEEAFWNLLGSVDSVSAQSVESLLESIQDFQEIDVPAVQDCAVLQQRPVCQISLLPQQMLPEMKLVSWNGLRCFVKVANCWGNLISHDPPVLAKVRVG